MAAKICGSGFDRSPCLSLYPGSKAAAASDSFGHEVARLTPPSLRPPSILGRMRLFIVAQAQARC